MFPYDGENRMLTSNVASMGTVTYSCDGEGRRVQKSWGCSVGNGTCTTVFVYDAMGQLAAEYATAPNTMSGTEYLTADSLGSTRLVTDGSGAVTQCYDYLPFGEEIAQGINRRGSCYPPSGVYPHAADATSMKFTGDDRDVETGLDWFKVRYFGSSMGRFTSLDP